MKRPRVALTQSPGRLEGLGSLLESRGIEVLRRPLIETVARTDPRTRAAAATLDSLPWLLIGSRSAVEALRGLAVALSGPRLGAVGPATAQAIESAGGTVTVLGVPHNAEGLAHAFLAHPQACGPVGLPRGNRALSTLEEMLGAAGIATRPLIVYDTVPSRWGKEQWSDGSVEALVLASPSAVEALPNHVALGSRIVTLGETTSAAARARGWECEEAAEPTVEATLAAVERVLA